MDLSEARNIAPKGRGGVVVQNRCCDLQFLDIRAVLAQKSLTQTKEMRVSKLVYATEFETCARAG